MTALLLRLASPTQGWDVRRWPYEPRSGRIGAHGQDVGLPTFSAIAGLLGSAMGRERDADFADLLGLTMLLRCDQPGRVRPEFRMTRRRSSQGVIPWPVVEQVRDDAVFLVGVEGQAGLIAAAVAGLRAPRWPLYLGRREYPPTEPILLGVTDCPVAVVMREHPWIAAPWYQREHAPDLTVRELRHVDTRGWAASDGRRPAPSPRLSSSTEPIAATDWFEVVSGA